MPTNLYTLRAGQLTAHTSTAPIELGEAGRGRNLHKLIFKGGACDGAPVTFKAIPGTNLSLAEPTSEGDLHVAIFTSRTYTRGCARRVKLFGAARLVARGMWAHGDAGRIGDGEDVLVRFPRGEASMCEITRGGFVVSDGEVLEFFGSKDAIAEAIAIGNQWVISQVRKIAHDAPEWAPILEAAGA
jgi:hypothetical protein